MCRLLALTILLISTNFLLFLQVHAAPVNNNIISDTHADVKKSNEEVNDLSKSKTKNQSSQLLLPHKDEEIISENKSLNWKNDVEELETQPIQKEKVELEERFRGPALRMQANNFISENIEVNSVDKETGFVAGLKRHEQLLIILSAIGLVSIIMYAVLILWRSQYHQRYGMRELLLATGNNYYEPNNNLNNNNTNNNSVYNTTTQNLVSGQ